MRHHQTIQNDPMCVSPLAVGHHVRAGLARGRAVRAGSADVLGATVPVAAAVRHRPVILAEVSEEED